MGRGNATLATFFVAIFIAIPSSSVAYVIWRVGDENGWTNRLKGSSPAEEYTQWASDKTFNIGDILVFVYHEENHTVVQTGSHDAYVACNSNVDDAQVWSSPGSPTANVILKAEGKTYFFCSAWDGGHCRAGMRFAIDVGHANPGGAAALAPGPDAPFAFAPAPSVPSGAASSTATGGKGGTGSPAKPNSDSHASSVTGGAAAIGGAIVTLILMFF